MRTPDGAEEACELMAFREIYLLTCPRNSSGWSTRRGRKCHDIKHKAFYLADRNSRKKMKKIY